MMQNPNLGWDFHIPHLFHTPSMNDPNWIIILFFIHLNAFFMEKVEESAHVTILNGGTHFGEIGSKNFRGHFEASKDIF